LALLFLEQFLPAAITAVVQPFDPAGAAKAGEYWQIVLGPLLLGVVLLEPLPGQSRSGWRAGFVGERGLRARPLISEGTGKAPVAAVADVHGLESLPQCAHDRHRNRTRR